jgi:ATP-binding cassette subfamily B protein
VISREYWLALSTILVVGISQTFVGMYALVLFQRLLDGFLIAKTLADISRLLTGYIILTVLNHLLIYVEGYPTSILNNGVYQRVKLRAMEKIARIDYQSYQNLGTGNLIQMVENGAQATRGILTEFYLAIARQVLPPMIISMAFIRYYDQTLFLIILSSYGFFYIFSFYLMRFLRQETEKLLSSQEDFSKFSVRAFMELVVFRINGRFKNEFERVKGISDEIVRSKAKIYLLQELFFTGFALLIFIVQTMVILDQAAKILDGTSTVGTLVALVGFISIVFFPISGLSMAWISYRLNSVTFTRFQHFLDLPEDLGLKREPTLKIKQGLIEFREVSFAYQDQTNQESPEVLHDFSLILNGGQTTAFVGTSGSGKTTLVRLLLQLLKPQQGQILIDGQDLNAVNLGSYYQSIGYIPQEPPIFDGTLRENLTFERVTNADRLEKVIHQVGLGDMVKKLPGKLETVVGERGIKLSGGERQRLAFGRMLLQDPMIVILDEPTAALDSLTEDFITRNMIPFLKGKTVILVAHRLQTVQNAERIVVLEEGKVLQSGSFSSLISIEGKFKQLWDKQAREETKQEIQNLL